MVKDYFLDAFIQFSIILSLLKSDYRDVNIYNQLNTLRGSFDGELVVSQINDFNNLNGRNPDFGYVHPKNARIEDVLRSVHSLGSYRQFRGVSSGIVNAFLVNETQSIGNNNGGNTASRLSPVGDNGLSHSNSVFNSGDEPTKEDMALIDVLWRYDIDLEVTVDGPLMWELEKEREIHLHKGLEEEAITLVEESQVPVSLIPTTRGDEGLDNSSASPLVLNTPDALDQSEFSLFNEQVQTQENMESDWTNLMNLFGVENGPGADVEGDMFSNLFETFQDINDIPQPLHPPMQEITDRDVNMPNVNLPSLACNVVNDGLVDSGGADRHVSPSYDCLVDGSDFRFYGDSLLDGQMELFEGLGIEDNSLSLMDDLNDDYDGLPDLSDEGVDNDHDESSSVIDGLTGGFHALSPVDHLGMDHFQRDEFAFTPSEGKWSDRASSRCSYSSDSLLAGCSGSRFTACGDVTDVGHDHTYNMKFAPLELEIKEEPEDELEIYTWESIKEEFKTTSRSKDEIKLQQLKVPFSLEEITNNPIDWFTDVISNPKYSLTPQQINLLKGIRKRGKNKSAAQNCRKRKLDEIQSVDLEVAALNNRKTEVARRYGSVENDADKLARKFRELQHRILNSVRRSDQKFEGRDLTLSFNRNGVVRVVDRNPQFQQQEWSSSATATNSDKRNRKVAKTKRKQAKRN